MVTNLISGIIKATSLQIHDTCLHIIQSINDNLVNDFFIRSSNILFVISISIVILYILFKLPGLTRMNGEEIRGQLKENKSHFQYLSLLVFVSFFSRDILSMTFNYWNKFFNETEILIQLKESALTLGEGAGDSVASSLILFTSVMIVLFVTLVQIIEVFSLVTLLFFAPIFLFGSMFNRQLPNIFIKKIISGVTRPITHTFTVGMMFTIFYPILKEQGNITPLTELIVLNMLIFISFYMTKNLDTLFIADKKEKDLNAIQKGRLL